jgi:hypothetical protein
MSTAQVSLKIAANGEREAPYRTAISPTLYDGFTDLAPEEPSHGDELRIATLEDVFPLMLSSDPIETSLIVLDLRSLAADFSRLMVYLSPILYRWTGQEMAVVLPPNSENPNALMAAVSDLLRSLELRSRGIRLISCPTCARCKTNFPEMVRSIESKLSQVDKSLDVAVMGCEVNGPGEAKAADIGIAFGDQKGMLFKRGEKIGVVSIEEAADRFLQEIDKL